MSQTEMRKLAFKEFNENVNQLILAVGEADYDLQIAYMEKAIRNLETAKYATLEIHGGISN